MNAEAASLCGPGFHVADDPAGTLARRPVKNDDGTVFGHVYLTYNNDNGKNCVVTIKSRAHGTETQMYAGLKVQGRSGPCGDGWLCEEGLFAHDAGGAPAHKTTVQVRGRCVQYFGLIWGGTRTLSPFGWGGHQTWGNCG